MINLLAQKNCEWSNVKKIVFLEMQIFKTFPLSLYSDYRLVLQCVEEVKLTSVWKDVENYVFLYCKSIMDYYFKTPKISVSHWWNSFPSLIFFTASSLVWNCDRSMHRTWSDFHPCALILYSHYFSGVVRNYCFLCAFSLHDVIRQASTYKCPVLK